MEKDVYKIRSVGERNSKKNFGTFIYCYFYYYLSADKIL